MPYQASNSARDWQKADCFGCGLENPHSLGANFTFDEASGEVKLKHHFKGFEIGPPGHVHGGVLASLLDEAQGALCQHLGHHVMTDQLTMKYRKAVPITSQVSIRCWVTAVRKRRIYTRGTISSAAGELMVASSASWYLLPERVRDRVFATTLTSAEKERYLGVLTANKVRAKKIRKRLNKKDHDKA